MKKQFIPFALVLCLVLCVFAFSSCGKNKAPASTTGAQTVPATTEKATTAPEPVVPAHQHVPESDYYVLSYPTCTTPGREVLYCAECGDEIEDREIPIDPNAHDVEWNVTKQPTLLDPTGHHTGQCSRCAQSFDEDTVFEHNAQTFTTSNGKYSPNYATVEEIRDGEHFYPTDENPDGKDLLVEYSILWNETLTDLDVSNDRMPTIDTRFAPGSAGTSGNSGVVRWELAGDTTSQWCTCKFAGGFEVAAFENGETDNPYPRFDTTVDDITAYPNIGGANAGDGQPLGDTQWGWHRVSIRYREEVTNVDAVKAGEAATYKLTMWVYIDGVLVLHFSDSDHMRNDVSYKLFTAESDGEGGITYVENDALYLHGAFMDSTRLEDGKNPGYSSIADYSVTVGTDFVQNVKKATAPAATTWEIASGVAVPSTIWYELAD